MRIVLRNLLPYLVSVIMLRMALTIPEAIGNEVFIIVNEFILSFGRTLNR